ncbi:leucine-rich repeat-containing protein egg-6-like [Chironomus tepperi]|uniref:leucine-rich repeat-containing protein egg-6-like n=1 Tax=Chironomus tepperi TaxID=113505 RepID=UPI00391F5C60
MRIRYILRFLTILFTLQTTLAIDIEINCYYRPDQQVWTAITTKFTTCELQADLKPSDVIKNAIGSPGTTANSAVKVFVSVGKKVLQIPEGLKAVFTALEGIQLEDTTFKFLDGESLKAVTGLKYLGITNGEMEVIFAETFKDLSSLMLLDLTGNPIMYVGSSAFTGTTGLTNLNLKVACLDGQANIAAGATQVTALLGLLPGNCKEISFAETFLLKISRDLLAASELAQECEPCGDEELCPTECTEELKNVKLQLNATAEDLKQCNKNITSLDADILDLEHKIEQLEAMISTSGDGTCGYKTVADVYSCYARISVRTAAEQTVKWNGTHEADKTNAAVLAMVIYSQTVEILPLNIGTVYKNLVSLTVRNSGLAKIKAGDFRTLTNLKTLEIVGNNITTIEAAAFAELTKLTKIDLSANRITALPNKVFDTLSALSILNLSDNSLRIRFDVINDNNRISEAYFRNNKAIVPFDKTFIWRLKNAVKIDLSGTECNFSLDRTQPNSVTFVTFYSNIVLNC